MKPEDDFLRHAKQMADVLKPLEQVQKTIRDLEPTIRLWKELEPMQQILKDLDQTRLFWKDLEPMQQILKDIEQTRLVGDNLKVFEAPLPPLPIVEPNQNLASEFYERLVKWIGEFEASLDDEHEVGAKLVNFGQTVTFHLRDLGYWNPSLISLKGVTDTDEPVELIQHVTQISILLMKVPRKNLDQPKRPIGFTQ